MAGQGPPSRPGTGEQVRGATPRSGPAAVCRRPPPSSLKGLRNAARSGRETPARPPSRGAAPDPRLGPDPAAPGRPLAGGMIAGLWRWAAVPGFWGSRPAGELPCWAPRVFSSLSSGCRAFLSVIPSCCVVRAYECKASVVSRVVSSCSYSFFLLLVLSCAVTRGDLQSVAVLSSPLVSVIPTSIFSILCGITSEKEKHF